MRRKPSTVNSKRSQNDFAQSARSAIPNTRGRGGEGESREWARAQSYKKHLARGRKGAGRKCRNDKLRSVRITEGSELAGPTPGLRD